MPGEFSNPSYVNPGAEEDAVSVITVANEAARLALLQANAAGRIIKQTADFSVWCLKPDGSPSNAEDWDLIGFFSLGTISSQAASAVNITGGSISGVELGAITFADAPAARLALGLNLVNNTADSSKPVSSAQGEAIVAMGDAVAAAAALDATSKASAAQGAAISAASADATAKANAAQAAAIAALSFGNTAPTNGYDTLEISGVTNPVGVNGLVLVEVVSPIVSVYPGKSQWSSDGSSSAPPTGSWASLYPFMLVTAAEATINDIAPPAGYTAAATQSEASNIEFNTFPFGSWSIYWLYDDGVNPPHWLSMSGGLTDQGSTVIPAGRLLKARPNGTDYDNLIGGLGETWESSPTAQFVWICTPYSAGSQVGGFSGISALPESVTYSAQSPATGVLALSRSTGVGATATPPFIRVHGGKAYMQEAGVWKEFNLSAIS